MKILILGAGAVGGYFGALLQNNGVDVTFLVRNKRAEQLKKHGLQITSQLGDISITPKVITTLHAENNFNLVIISCKAYALEDALKSLAPLNQSAFILPLLNGISHYSRLEAFFGKKRILGGFAHLSTVLDDNGNIAHLNKLQVLTIGALEADQDPFLQHCQQVLSPVAPFIVFSDNIRISIWKKLAFIATASAATCLMKKPMGAIVSAPEGARQVSGSFELNCRAAAYAGYEPDDEWKDLTLRELLNPEFPMTSSLLRDIQNGNQAELTVLEDMLQANRSAGLQNDLLEAAYLELQRYELKRTA